MVGLSAAILAAVVFVVLKLSLDARNCIKKLSNSPGRLHWTIVSPLTALVILVGKRFPPRGWFMHYDARFSQFAKEGTTVLSGILFGSMKPIFLVADIDGMKQLTSDRGIFSKDLKAYEHVDIFGKSIISTDGSEWRRHLAALGPAFSDANNAMVWRETRRLVQEWISTELLSDTSSNTSKIVDGLESMRQLTLHVISAAAFGMRTHWSAFSDHRIDELTLEGIRSKKESYLLPFHSAMEYTLSTIFVRAGSPNFLYKLPINIPWLSDQLAICTAAFASLKIHMCRLVDGIKNGQAVVEKSREIEDEEHSNDLLRRLVEANEAGIRGGKKGNLSDSELYSNIFTLMLAGHETTAHSMTFAFTCLGLYPDIQRKIREEVFRVWPTEDDITTSTYKSDFDRLTYTMAFFREVLRCFPMTPRLVKVCTEDATLMGRTFTPASNIIKPETTFDGSINHVGFKRDEKSERKVVIPVPKGSLVMMDIWGLHLNPLVWGDDAHEFKPERFIDTDTYKWPRDGFLSFSAGPRGCTGKQFAYVEATVTLALIMRNFELFPVVPESRYRDREELRREILNYTTALSTRPTMTKVVFRPYLRHLSEAEEA